MNTAVKALWIAALRSGEYTQGKRYLQADGKFCPLGVLCDRAVKHGVIDEPMACTQNTVYTDHARLISTKDTITYYRYGAEMQSCALPWDVVEWAGLAINSSPHNPDIYLYGRVLGITYANDCIGLPFDEMADAIDESL